MATDTGIIYVIAIGCFVFGAVSAYLIYRNVQEEKANYFKDKLRRKQLKKDPINFDYTAPREQKRTLPGPVVEPEVNKPDSHHVIPVPAPILAPIAVPPLPIPEPVTTYDTAPLLDNNGAYHNSNNDALFTAAPAAAVSGAAAGAGAFAAYQTVKPEPEDEQPKKTKKAKKRKGSNKKVLEEDFDDYRNFTPTVLPPPKDAPPKANYTPSGSPEVQPPQYVQAVDIDGGQPGRDLGLPPVAIVNRDGLLF